MLSNQRAVIVSNSKKGVVGEGYAMGSAASIEGGPIEHIVSGQQQGWSGTEENEPRLVGELLDLSEEPPSSDSQHLNNNYRLNNVIMPNSPSSFDMLGKQHEDIGLDSLRRVLLPVEVEHNPDKTTSNLTVHGGNTAHDASSSSGVSQRLKEPVKPHLTNKEYKHERPHVFVDTSHAKTSVQVMKLCLEDLGWYEIRNHFQHASMRAMRVPDIFWHACAFEDTPCIPYSSEIRINKFPGMVQIVRKNSLTYAIRRLQQFFPSDFKFYPRSWNIPEEIPQLIVDHERETDERAASGRRGRGTKKNKKMWLIFKPDDASQGTGIFLEDNPRNIDSSLAGSRNYLVQQYIDNPLLIDGLKFDFRVYVLLRNLSNVQIFLSREGMARFCTEKYEAPSSSNKSRVYMHLTNYSLNKYSDTYDYNNSMTRGSKRLLSSVFNFLQSEGYNVTELWTKIEQISVKTVFAILPDLLVAYRDEIPPNKQGPQCFQILGFDILVDDKFEPHLLEVNANPSLNLDHETEIGEDGLIGVAAPNHPGYQLVHSPVDEEIKRPVVLESLLLACPTHHRHKTLRFLTKYGVQCAVHYPDGEGVVSNNDDPLRQEPCLYLVYNCADSSLDYLRFMEQLVTVYVFVLGTRSNRGSQSAFRSFMRKTKLASSGAGASSASVDLLFIKMTKRWFPSGTSSSSSSNPGLNFDSFVDTFLELASRRYKDYPCSGIDKVKLLIKHCFHSLQIPPDFHWYPDTTTTTNRRGSGSMPVHSSRGGGDASNNSGHSKTTAGFNSDRVPLEQVERIGGGSGVVGNSSLKGQQNRDPFASGVQIRSNKYLESDSKQKVLNLRASSERQILSPSNDLLLETSLKLQLQDQQNSHSQQLRSSNPLNNNLNASPILNYKTAAKDRSRGAKSRIPKLNYRQSNFPLFSRQGPREVNSAASVSRLPVPKQTNASDRKSKQNGKVSSFSKQRNSEKMKSNIDSDDYDSDFFSM
ncbi:tubulin polyglutamylase TTLL11-like isoform X2 [Symsagittifera roscoffensis]|uniref:tubulin polyglutamylase TTLL11-like isoform X2 n=1 Tax=Symsagittifera roscoffensis TaxID=84072 RepID=UPI00307B9C6C